MVAIIKSSASLRNVLNYNEQKIKQDVAELIHSKNFAKDTGQLIFTDKLKTIEKLTTLNQRTTLNAVHISLNFDPSEKLNKEKLQAIADAYMNGIGFGQQPYLVYVHKDSAHPHIHIVSTNINRDGSRIKMQNIGRERSEPVRKQIEKDYGLVTAQGRELKEVYELKPVNAQKIQYGKAETKRAITNVLNTVLTKYKYSSLAELNAVLKQYNVLADRGSENSRTYKNRGLVYRVLNEKGEKIGTPVKASNINGNPGLQLLEEKFKINEQLKTPLKLRVKNAIDLVFTRQKGQSMEELITMLGKEKIQVVLRQNDAGIIYGTTFIDHQNKCVFNGSDLGKEYSAKRILERIQEQQLQNHKSLNIEKPAVKEQPMLRESGKTYYERGPVKDFDTGLILSELKGIMDALTNPVYEGYVPFELRQQIKRKRRRNKPHH